MTGPRGAVRGGAAHVRPDRGVAEGDGERPAPGGAGDGGRAEDAGGPAAGGAR